MNPRDADRGHHIIAFLINQIYDVIIHGNTKF